MDYLKMNVTRKEVIILDRFIEITWTSWNKEWYTALGYAFTGNRKRFWCNIEDVSPGSAKRVLVKCPSCEETRTARYEQISKTGHTLCQRCAQMIDIAGMKFGRFIAIKPDACRNGTNSYWICECECGTIKSVRTTRLINGYTVSCGCYMKETKSGPNSYFWNHDLTDEERIIRRGYPEYAQWVKGVMERDNWTCQCCGQYGGTIDAHHLYSYRQYPEHQTNVDNGITLCRRHHKEFHDWMGGTRVPCTPQDFYNWLESRKYSQ